MQIDPFYAVVLGDGAAYLWHDSDQCLLAEQIVPGLRRPGTNSAPHCPYCALLNRPLRPCRPQPPRLVQVLPCQVR